MVENDVGHIHCASCRDVHGVGIGVAPATLINANKLTHKSTYINRNDDDSTMTLARDDELVEVSKLIKYFPL